MTSRLALRAPAKLNITLEILGKLSSKLHALRSVMVPITWYDEINVVFRPENPGFTASHPALEKDNLVLRALKALDVNLNSVRIHLKKNIPMGAGLGGGSSDAASVLIAACNGFFGETLDKDYVALAQTLGSDVSFFLAQTGALVEGTGERVTALGGLPAWWSVVVHPAIHIATASAYLDLDSSRTVGRARKSRAVSVSLQAVSALQAADFDAVENLLSNDFQSLTATKYPPVQQALEALRGAGAKNPTLTGSGACVFALTQTQNEAREICARLQLPAAFGVRVAAFEQSSVWVSNGESS